MNSFEEPRSDSFEEPDLAISKEPLDVTIIRKPIVGADCPACLEKDRKINELQITMTENYNKEQKTKLDWREWSEDGYIVVSHDFWKGKEKRLKELEVTQIVVAVCYGISLICLHTSWPIAVLYFAASGTLIYQQLKKSN